MKNFIVQTAELWIALIFLIMIIRFWSKRFMKNQNLDSINKTLAVFLIGHIITIFGVILFGIDDHNQAYLVELNVFSSEGSDYWTYLSVEILSFITLYIVVVLLANLVYRIAMPTDQDIKEEIYNDNWMSILIYAVILIALACIGSNFIIRPFLLDWAMEFSTFKPIY